MKKELIEFIANNSLSPFNSDKVALRASSIYRTKEAKEIHTKVQTRLAQKFVFSATAKLWYCFPFTSDQKELQKRQEFSQSIANTYDNTFLKKLRQPKKSWKPDYDIVVVTEDHKTFMALKELDIPCQLLTSERDVLELESRELVQSLDLEEFKPLIDQLPQAMHCNSVDEVYLERFLEQASGWKGNIEMLKDQNLPSQMKEIIEKLDALLDLTVKQENKIIHRDEVESQLEKINNEISDKLRSTSISGDSLLGVLQKGLLPAELQKIVNEVIDAHKINQNVLVKQFPVIIDEQELHKTIQRQSADTFTSTSGKISAHAHELKEVPILLELLQQELIFFDFASGLAKYIKEDFEYPKVSDQIKIERAKNLFLLPAQEISFSLDQNTKCSILTGANSGGKTTLIEHMIQIISLMQLGLPLNGKIEMPLFTDIYYFAKNKGSASKGAFETLLTQMASINPGNKTMIFADEIEAVTEPGVAGKIVAATSDFFIKQDCFVVIATHLGHEIKDILPDRARIDGIEAKGLDDQFNLIIDHNPVLGRLAHSTPELIIEKMANTLDKDYFKFVNEFIKNN